MTKGPVRTFSRDFKLKVLERLEAGETIALLAAEFEVHRQLLYKWRDAKRAGTLGSRRGRPTRAQSAARAAGGVSELEQARRRIAELERKVGQQAVELDFFQGALRRIKGSRPASD
jgi:transposase-like protein